MGTGCMRTAMGICSGNSGPARLGPCRQEGMCHTSQPFPTWRGGPSSENRQAQERGPDQWNGSSRCGFEATVCP